MHETVLFRHYRMCGTAISNGMGVTSWNPTPELPMAARRKMEKPLRQRKLSL